MKQWRMGVGREGPHGYHKSNDSRATLVLACPTIYNQKFGGFRVLILGGSCSVVVVKVLLYGPRLGTNPRS